MDKCFRNNKEKFLVIIKKMSLLNLYLKNIFNFFQKIIEFDCTGAHVLSVTPRHS